MNQDDFERFIAWLDPDRDEACKKYEKIRRRIMTICRVRGIPESEAEEIFDEVIDRVVRKVPEIAEGYVGDPALYCYGVARNVIYEWFHRPRPPMPPPVLDDPNKKEQRDRCLRHCLEQRAPEDRRLLLEYYSKDGREKIELRRRLAAELGISENAFRIRLSRLRATLKDCLEECLKKYDE
jgi:DNA-directed RNA polymerase specialized sigma24 family protein